MGQGKSKFTRQQSFASLRNYAPQQSGPLVEGLLFGMN